MPRPLRLLLPALLVLALLGAWELYVDVGGVDSLLLPAPHAIASALYSDRGQLGTNFLVTAREIVLGIGAATVAALTMAFLVHLSSVARHAILPLLVASQAVPVVLVAPVLLFWLGFGILPKLAVIGLVAFFPLVVTTLAALEQVDPNLIKLMRTFDATRLQTFRRIELPAALPGLFTGAKLAAVFSVIGAVFAEWAGADRGLGYLFTVAFANLQVSEAYSAAVILAAFAILLYGLLSLLERRLLPWAHAPQLGDRP